MALVNSRRRLDKVTYTPVVLPAAQDGGGALEIAGYVNGLGLLPGEAESSVRGAQPHTAQALEAMESLVTAADVPQRLDASAKLARFSGDTLADAVDRIRGQRDAATSQAIADLKSLIDEYRAVQKRREQESQTSGNPAFNERLQALESRIDLLMSPSSRAASPVNRALMFGPIGLSVGQVAGEAVAKAVPDAAVAIPAVVASRLGNDLASSAWAAASWADAEAPERARRLTETTALVLAPALRATAAVLLMQGLPHLISQTQKAVGIKAALTRRTLQPIGLLHLEQLVMTPLEVERGELVYSLPLAPKEKATVAHKEWSLHQEEYSRFVQDYFENYSERGVAEKSDIAVSSKTESEHSKTLSMTLPTGSGAATLADPVQQAGAVDVTTEKQSQEKSRRDTREVTERASALAIRDQKVSFTVTTVSGREDFTARLYENPSDDKVMLVDYFRRMRKWHNELFRVGVRLTYDVVLPDPGRRLRSRWSVLADLDAQIATPFQFTLGVPRSPEAAEMEVNKAAATLGLGAVTSAPKFEFDKASVDDLVGLGRRYGITLPPAPDTLKALEEVKDITQKPVTPDTAVPFSFKLPGIPDTHRASRIYIGGVCAASPNANARIDVSYWSALDLSLPQEGTFDVRSRAVAATEPSTPSLVITGIAYGGAVGEVRAWVDLVPTPAAWREWRGQVWAALRQAELTRFNEKREALRQRRAALQRELEAPDALQLRRMEREQIAHLVLEWLFPDFGKGAGATSAAEAGSPAVWQQVLEYGEYIKFVQEAIDWDRVLVLLYPYFWDRPEQHAAKLYLNHPDGLHREFLRAGAARVVLAIRPGFEAEVVSLLDQGKLGALSPASRFRPLIAAVEAREKAFQERRDAALVPSENGAPPEDVPSYGDSIGAWFDWTPTSALDMTVTLTDVE
jgi:hypothetical protein